jgi:RNA polymerase sigma factor (TIGR02999 family)
MGSVLPKNPFWLTVSRVLDSSGTYLKETLSLPPMNDVTRILSAVEQGDSHAAEQLLPLVYDELRTLAAQKLAQEKPGQTLQATALVHEAYLRLVDVEKAQHWNSRGHFFGAAAEAMRRILVDHAREKGRAKRGGDCQHVDVDALALATAVTPDQLLAIDDALAQLERDNPIAAQIVKLRYFTGLTVEEAGQALGVATTTAYRHWNYARAWLHSELLDTETK